MASIVALSGGTTLGGSYCAAAVETNRTKVREADRKSTRLNSSQGYISYAVFCLKKKKIIFRSERKSTRSKSRHGYHPYPLDGYQYKLNAHSQLISDALVTRCPSCHSHHRSTCVA